MTYVEQICHIYLLHLSTFLLHMQVLFIAPVHGKKKPQLSYPHDVKDKDTSINNLETLKQNSEFLNRALDVKRERLENIVKRPKRSGSKVCLLPEDTRFYCALMVAVLILFGFLHAGIRLVPRSKRVYISAWVAPCRCRDDRRIWQLCWTWQRVGRLYSIFNFWPFLIINFSIEGLF